MLNPDVSTCSLPITGGNGKNGATRGRFRATRIGEVKRVAYDGFLLARDRSPDVREFGALLRRRRSTRRRSSPRRCEAGLDVGTPAEKAGAFPLAWSTEPF